MKKLHYMQKSIPFVYSHTGNWCEAGPAISDELCRTESRYAELALEG